MVAGHLQEKNGYYYAVLSYTDSNGKRRQPWIPTGLPVKGNKKRAEQMLLDIRRDFVSPSTSNGEELSTDMQFADFMEAWLEIAKCSIVQTTIASYTQMVKGKIVPYFKNKRITLRELQASDIQSFYMHELKTLSANSVIHEHANIHKALKYAVKMGLIPYNPSDKVERPKMQKYIADYYRVDELNQLIEATKDHPYGLLIRMTAFYGFRRSEVIGLRWDAIDFQNNVITVKHVVTEADVDGKRQIFREDRAKTQSSLRSLPLIGNIRELLLAQKKQQEENKRICGKAYNTEFDGYVFVDAMGNLIRPDDISRNFGSILKKNGLRHIRFHDLRHSCASALIANDIPIKEIQEWLGHSDIQTTANIYSHLEFSAKNTSAAVMESALNLFQSEVESDETD